MLPTSLVVAIASIYEFSLSESNVLESVVIENFQQPTSLVVAIASIYEFSLSESNVLESVVIENFHLGYDNETITDLPQVYHSITMSVCTLTRRLQSYNLVERQNQDINL